MSTETTYYHLTKPDPTDPISLSVLDQNFDTIDATLKTMSNVLDVGQYMDYWWKRRTNSGWISNLGVSSKCFFVEATSSSTSYTTATTAYADSINIDSSTGVISLEESTASCTCTYIDPSGLNAVKGKYVQNTHDGHIWYIPADAADAVAASITDEGDTSKRYKIYMYGQLVSSTQNVSEWELVHSSADTTYPKSGISSGYEYVYFGNPLANSVTAPKIATGSYVGTGAYGSSNPNILELEFVPKFVIVTSTTPSIESNGPFAGWFIYASGMTFGLGGFQFSVNENAFSWYHSSGSASSQLNVLLKNYTYVVIG